MIRNLNQMTFQGFGTIPPERAQNVRNLDKGNLYELNGEEATVYRAMCETWISCGSGTSVLSVSRDGENFQHYYLDKRVCVSADVIFSLSPFQGESSAYVSARVAPEEMGKRVSDALRIERRIRVDGLYTFFFA